jgi:peptidoglycan/LPS O-acetylase OafA/YrhL
VPLFFVISGFCIHLRWARDAAAGRPVRVGFLGFWKRRLWRLYPAYLGALIVAMGLLVVRVWRGFPSPYAGDFVRWLTTDFFAHASMLHGLHPDLDYQGGNVVFWTLAREEYLYLLYFPLLAMRRVMPMARVCLVVGLAGLLVPWTVSGLVAEHPAGFARLVAYAFNDHSSALALWVQWVLGAVAVEAFAGLGGLAGWTRSWFAVIGWAVLAEMAGASSLGVLVPMLWGLCFFTLVNASIHRESAAGHAGGRVAAFFAFTGRFSYSLYLIHLPALVVLQKAELAVRALLGLQSLAASPAYLLSAWLLFVAGGWLAGWAFFQAVERHFLPSSR